MAIDRAIYIYPNIGCSVVKLSWIVSRHISHSMVSWWNPRVYPYPCYTLGVFETIPHLVHALSDNVIHKPIHNIHFEFTCRALVVLVDNSYNVCHMLIEGLLTPCQHEDEKCPYNRGRLGAYQVAIRYGIGFLTSASCIGILLCGLSSRRLHAARNDEAEEKLTNSLVCVLLILWDDSKQR